MSTDIATELGFDPQDLEKSLRRPRSLISYLLSTMVAALTITATIPLFSVLWMLFYRGGKKLSVAVFTQLPPAPLEEGGGFGNAIVGTLQMVGIAALISVPVGIIAAMYLSEVGRDSKFATIVRFSAKVMTGVPSILAGVFAYGAVVLVTGTFSALAGGIALAILMLPTVMLTAEEAIRMVPNKMREAAIGMGCNQTQTIWKIVFPTALPGVLTGVMLAVARAAGETAPLLFTALNSNFWPSGNVMKPTASLAVLIYQFSQMPYDNMVELAWAASLVLVLVVLALNLIGQALSRRTVQR